MHACIGQILESVACMEKSFHISQSPFRNYGRQPAETYFSMHGNLNRGVILCPSDKSELSEVYIGG